MRPRGHGALLAILPCGCHSLDWQRSHGHEATRRHRFTSQRDLYGRRLRPEHEDRRLVIPPSPPGPAGALDRLCVRSHAGRGSSTRAALRLRANGGESLDRAGGLPHAPSLAAEGKQGWWRRKLRAWADGDSRAPGHGGHPARTPHPAKSGRAAIGDGVGHSGARHPDLDPAAAGRRHGGARIHARSRRPASRNPSP